MRALTAILTITIVILSIYSIINISANYDKEPPRFTIGESPTVYTEYNSEYVCQFGIAYNNANSKRPTTLLVDANNKPLKCTIIK